MYENQYYFEDEIKVELFSNGRKVESFSNERKEESFSDERYIQKFSDFIINGSNTKPISTGFKGLDNILDGGFYGDCLYVIGSASSVGKTSLILQMAESIAKQSHTVLLFSFEMSGLNLAAKQLSRISLIRSGGNKIYSGTTRDFMNGNYQTYKCKGEVIQLDEESQQLKMKNMLGSIDEYAEIADKMFVCEGGVELNTIEIISNEVRKFRFYDCRPVIIVDYIQLLSSKNGRKSEKQLLDENMTILKKLAREEELTIIVVSSFNRESYEKPASMSSCKESGAIEYGADVLMALQFAGVEEYSKKIKAKEKIEPFDINMEKRKDPRKIELLVLKNRNGETGGRIKLDYYSQNNYFKEIE